MNKKAMITYICLVYGLTWALWGIVFLITHNPTMLVAVSPIAMFMPTISYILTAKICHFTIPWKDMLRPRFKTNKAYYALAWFLPAVVAIIGCLLYYLVFTEQLDLSLRYLGMMIAQSETNLTPGKMLLIQVVSAITYAPLVNCISACGEEIGWRGFLYPALRAKRSPLKAHLLCGFLWAFWHTPLNLTGYNYGLVYPGYPIGGILAMTLMCFSVGVVSSMLYEKTSSIIPCGILHGAWNAIGSLGILIQKPMYINGPYTLLGPASNGLLAGLPITILACFILFHQRKETTR